MKKILLIGAVLLTMTACTDANGSRDLLESQGYTDVNIKGHAWFGCSDKDKFKTKFTAKNANGKVVKGTVCKGLLKNKTIRFD